MKKAIVIILAAALLIGATVATTMAWLTDSTNKITNEFTIGKIDVELDESNFNDNKLVPGKTLTKNPRVTVKQDSEKCYLFVEVEIADDLAAVINYSIDDGWSLLTTDTNATRDNYKGIIYRIVDTATNDDQVYPILKNNQVIVKGKEITAAELSKVDVNDTFSFAAYAVQYDYISNEATEPARAQAAWSAAAFPTT
jgi:predicted ribosomally synthesized peptide with SipW-like signal peptide